jgi:predicted phosphate transport protein (TIGR00153 family)
MSGVLDFLLPREKKFIEMLIVQSDILHQGASEFNKFIVNFNSFSESEIMERRNAVKEIEHKGDEITRKISDSLHETFITPIDREDILILTQSMDDILDFIHETTTKIRIYKVKKMPKDMKIFSKKILECCTIIKSSMHNLKNYVEIKKAILDLHNIEVEADRLFFKCVGEIFENNHNVKDLIKFKEIYESVEEAINMCDKVGDILGAIVVKHG